MKIVIAVLLSLSANAQAAELAAVKACVKWSKDIPGARSAGSGLFASVERVEGPGPFAACDVVVETESFGVGWLMRAWMKEAVLSPCGRRLGGYRFSYKGDAWQTKLVSGLHGYLKKHPEALEAAKDCPSLPTPTPSSAP